jgi:hypothetical protein
MTIDMAVSKTQRLSLIREIVSRLSGESWRSAELVLKTFDIQSDGDWSGNSLSDYLMYILTYGTDAALIELAEHLGYTIGHAELLRAEPEFWHKGYFRLFLSHLATHREWIGRLKDELAEYGISAFVAHEDIEPTADWQNQIELALMTCEGLVALLHEDFHQSKWTDQEIGYAMGRKVPVYSVRCGEDPYGFIGRFQAFNGKNATPKKIAGEIYAALCKNGSTQNKMGDALVGAFIESDSFSEAQDRMAALQRIQVWDSTYAKRLRDAVESNSQLRYAFNVPDKVEALIKKWQKKSP